MTEQEINQMMAGLRRSRDQFRECKDKATGQHTPRRTTERDREIREAFRNR
ncbi:MULTISPECIES: hypothetical protein [Pectobacterium]|jgi:hypothetical protein|uniref:hypothetical protein n=1 Tax=Pectobacterium TaxID=122277 RepID=UPI000AD3AD82|nr:MULTISPECIES: hypothetical protein [Pectobacterium]POW25032.1 hypothetical protein PB20LOC_03572 [Pectobacterium parmentieri]